MAIASIIPTRAMTTRVRVRMRMKVNILANFIANPGMTGRQPQDIGRS